MASSPLLVMLCPNGVSRSIPPPTPRYIKSALSNHVINRDLNILLLPNSKINELSI